MVWHDCMSIDKHTPSDDVRLGMPLSAMCSTHDHTTSGVTCSYRPWAAHTGERRQAWHAIIALEYIHGWKTSGVAFHLCP